MSSPPRSRGVHRYVERYTRDAVTKIEPIAIEFAQYVRQQWTLLLKYIEGPVYAKTIEITEQVRCLFTRGPNEETIFLVHRFRNYPSSSFTRVCTI